MKIQFKLYPKDFYDSKDKPREVMPGFLKQVEINFKKPLLL